MPKRIVPLSDVQVSKAKPKESDYKLSDGGGLYLLVTPTNGKLWRMNYRFNDKRKTAAFGAYPVVSLADARQRREEAKKLLANGVDPGEMKKALKQAKTALLENCFEFVAREWHTKFQKNWVKKHGDNKLQRLDKNIFPWVSGWQKTPEPIRGASRLLEHRQPRFWILSARVRPDRL